MVSSRGFLFSTIIAAEETLEQQIINREEREKSLHQIEALEKRCRIEKQTRKKYELHQQLLKLKERIANE